MEFASEMIVKAAVHNVDITEVPIDFYKDRRDRRPHLRPFRDGWRHLRLLLWHAPDHMMTLPGLIMLALGLLLAFTQLAGPVSLGFTSLDIHYMILGVTLSLVGTSAISLGLVVGATMPAGRVKHLVMLTPAYRYYTFDAAAVFARGPVPRRLSPGRLCSRVLALPRPRDSQPPFFTRLTLFGLLLIAIGRPDRPVRDIARDDVHDDGQAGGHADACPPGTRSTLRMQNEDHRAGARPLGWMKILLVTHYYSTHAGGIEILAGTLASLLGASHDVVWLASDCDRGAGGGRADRSASYRCDRTTRSNVSPACRSRSGGRDRSSASGRKHAKIATSSTSTTSSISGTGSIRVRVPVPPETRAHHPARRFHPLPEPDAAVRAPRLMHATLGRVMLGTAGQVVFYSRVVQDMYARFVHFRRPPLHIANGVDTAIFVPASGGRPRTCAGVDGTGSFTPGLPVRRQIRGEEGAAHPGGAGEANARCVVAVCRLGFVESETMERAERPRLR